MVRTKIIATLGPASSDETVLRKMILKGLDMVRLNFSHGSHQEHIQRITTVRLLNRKLKRAIKIMQDLEGYRIRLGTFKNKKELRKNMLLYLSKQEGVEADNEVCFDYHESLKLIKPGTLVYIDDGKILLRVVCAEKYRVKTKVVIPGVLRPRKGVNILGVKLPFSSITDKDRKDIKVACRYELDFVAQSFVRSRKDIEMLRKTLGVHAKVCQVYAKIENAEALKNLEGIIAAADGIIVARGDLGICLPIYKVPVVQKEIMKRCRLQKKAVVVATQMLDSMTYSRLPTRAEVSDVANAIIDGANALLLSAETAVGNHPHLVIDMMNKIIKNTEEYERLTEQLLL